MFFNDEHKDEYNIGKYWKDLNINYELMVEIASQKRDEEIKTILNRMTLSQLSELFNILNLSGEYNKKDLYINDIIKNQSDTANLEIILLDDFSKRKKRAIEEFYDSNLMNLSSDTISSTFGKLFFAYKNDRCNLFQILTLDEWNSRGTGYEMTCKSDKVEWNFLYELINNDAFREEFKNHLYEVSDHKQKYKLKSFCTMNKDNLIFMIYKLKADTQKSDFDISKRVKDVDKIIVKINMKSNSVHIKCGNKLDISYIYSYLKEKTQAAFERYEEPIYTDYNEDEFKSTFTTVEKTYLRALKDFKIDKIEFSESLLDMSPSLALSLPKRNVWPAVTNVVSRKVVNINSLSSIKSMNIIYKNLSRRINSVTLDNGSVVFKLQDSNLNPKMKKEIEDCFKLFFNIPLNERVNDKLEKGRADNIDLILRLKSKENLDEYNLNIFEELVDNNIINYKETFKNLCKNTECRNDMGKSNVCKSCGEIGYKTEKVCDFKINRENLLNLILDSISNGLKLDKDAVMVVSNYSIDKIDLSKLTFNYKSKDYQIIVSDSIIPRKTMIKIEKMLIPTIMIYYGVDKYQAKEITPSTMEKLQFGYLFANKDDVSKLELMYESLIENVDKLYQYHIISVSTESNHNIRKIVLDDTKVTKEEYTYNDLEDDTYAIIKDLFYNSDKWGRENIGEAVPEGVFAMSYIEDGPEAIEKKYAFSYDCKLTAKEKGYDLGRAEKRKAEDYVDQLNNEAAVKAYCSNRFISAHIFIGNKFKDTQIEDMRDYFYDKMPRGCSTMPMFIKIGDLLKLHDWYRTNYQHIKLNMHRFYEELYKIMINRKNIIDESLLNKFFRNMSIYFKNSQLDIESIKDNLTD